MLLQESEPYYRAERLHMCHTYASMRTVAFDAYGSAKGVRVKKYPGSSNCIRWIDVFVFELRPTVREEVRHASADALVRWYTSLGIR